MEQTEAPGCDEQPSANSDGNGEVYHSYDSADFRDRQPSRNYDARSILFVLKDMLEWKEGVCYEVRAWGHVYGATLKHGKTVSGYFDNLGDMIRAVIGEQGEGGLCGQIGGIYILPQPVPYRLIARAYNRLNRYAEDTTADEEVLHRKWLLVDCDSIRPKGLSATDEEHDRAIARARDVRDYVRESDVLPDPILADSGNGAHLVYRIDLPNDKWSNDYLHLFLSNLYDRFTDNYVKVEKITHNASRLFRFYGTPNKKGDEIAGNIHRISRILEIP